jgi:hypothetical protein
MASIPAPTQVWAGPGPGATVSEPDLITQSRQMLRVGIVQLMLDAGWTVPQSCDSTQVQSTNLWTVDGALMWALPGSAHSWIELVSPSGYLAGGRFIHILISLEYSTADTISITGATTAFTGGTTTASPTATTNTFHYKQNITFVDSGAAPSTYWGIRNSTGGDFFFAINVTSSGYYRFIFSVNKVNAFTPAINYPVVFTTSVRFGLGVLGATFEEGISTPGGSHLWLNNGHRAGAPGILTPTQIGTNPLGQIGSGGDSLSGLYPGIPIICASWQDGAYWGTIQDMYLAPTGSTLPNGFEIPTPPPSQYGRCGNAWVPTLGITPPV